MRTTASKIITDRAELLEVRAAWRAEGRRMVFTNGTFDILHAGHLSYLEWSRQQGDLLVVGLNSDASIRRIKGAQRPVVREDYRLQMMAGLECVDVATVFEEDEPRDLIAELLPDILVKAEDWAHYVSGREEVEANGGEVRLAPMVEGLSTSALIARILELYRPESE